MKKKRLLKTLSFSSLAVLMAVAGTFAFAPLGASPSTLANADVSDTINTVAGNGIEYAPSPLGLDPENDPVIYTTASGLEIKYGGLDIEASLSSSNPNLIGYPYFTMGTYNGYAVNWVIIGLGSNVTMFSKAMNSYLFSTWQTTCNPTYSNMTTNYQYFLKNIYETTTPAGSAIKNVISSKSYVADLAVNTKPVQNSTSIAEIGSGNVLVISECCLGYSYFNCPDTANSEYLYQSGSVTWGGRYRYISSSSQPRGNGYTFTYSTTGGTLYTYINNLYSSKLGLTSSQKNLIQGQKLKTIYLNGTTAYLETSSTDGNTTHKMFPMAGFMQATHHYNTSGYNVGTENFIISTYLSSNDLRKAYQIGTTTGNAYWLRGSEPGGYSTCGGSVGTDRTADGIIDGYYSNINYGVRPACVIKLS